MDPIDIGLLVRYLCLSYLKDNQTVLQSQLPAQQLSKLFIEHIANSPELATLDTIIKECFMFAFIWSFGGILAAGVKQAREEFDSMVRM